ncbi:hypothetical protein [Aliarcobacter butzleri]|uniref:hypothetical protein n=1 Tax=Aliarcobacter butzleri TaxID=28197 RepID=UPI00264882E4|nr:hypothetical protein [Aliarcobacter butzleri]
MTPDILDISITLVIYFILIFQYRKLNKSLFLNPVSPILLVFSISIATVNYFYRIGDMNDNEYFTLMIQFFIYFIFLFITPWFVKNRYINLSNYMNITRFDIQIAKIIFYISITIGLIYIFLLWWKYGSGDERFILNRNMRELMLFNSLFSIWALFLSSVIYSKTKQKKFLYYVVILILLSGFMGAKSTPVIGLLVFLFFYFQCNKINAKYLFIIGGIGICLLILPTYFMYGNPLEKILTRIFWSADMYIWAFSIGDYKQFIDYYNPISYILHPYSSLIGIRGYEYNFGAQIIESANLSANGMGPQDHMPMLGLIFYNNCFLCIMVFSIIFASIMLFTILFVFYFFSKTNISLSLRVMIFSLLYTTSFNMFLSVNIYSFNIIIAILGLSIYFIFYFLKKISSIDKGNK